MKQILLTIVACLAMIFLPMFLAQVLAETLANASTGFYVFGLFSITVIGTAVLVLIVKYALKIEEDDDDNNR